jgi:transposase
MRVATLFKRLLGLGEGRVVAVDVIEERGEQVVVVDLARRRNRRMSCSGCGRRCRAVYDRGIRSWRHLDVFRVRCRVRCEVRRVMCSGCGVCAEVVPWARVGSRCTRAFEDSVVWLARAAAKSVVAELLRVDWETVGRMIERVVSEHTRDRDGDGLDGLRRIGIDEVAYRKGHRYLMCVVCHDTGRVVWAAPGRSQVVAAGFFQQLGSERCKQISAVSVDLHGGWLGDRPLLPQRRRVRRPDASLVVKVWSR